MNIVGILATIFVIGFGVYFGRVVADHSKKAEKIHGGKQAELFHLAACSIMAGLVPSILIEVFVFRLGFGSILIGLSLMGVMFLCLMGFASIELPARANAKRNEDKGWTAEDARTSGL